MRPAERVGQARGGVRGPGRERGARLSLVHTGLETQHRAQHLRLLRAKQILAPLQATEQSHGGPEVRRHGADARKALRRHADYGERNAMHDHLAADDPRVAAELSLPRIVAQDQHRLARWGRGILREQRAAQRGRGAEHAKRVARHHTPEHGSALGARERVGVRKTLGRYRQRTDVLVLLPGEAVAPAAAVLKRHFVQRARVADRQRPQDVGVEDREDAGVQPEAERDRQHDRGDERRGAAKATQREADVLTNLQKSPRSTASDSTS